MTRSRAQAVSRRHYRWQWFWLLLSLPLALLLMLHEARADSTCGKLTSLADLKGPAQHIVYQLKPAQPAWSLVRTAMPADKRADVQGYGDTPLADAMADAKRDGSGWVRHFWYSDCSGF